MKIATKLAIVLITIELCAKLSAQQTLVMINLTDQTAYLLVDRGVYRALLSARIQHVLQYDSIRYLRVDALPTSRPILERYGFKVVASTWPAEWPPAPVGR